MKLNLHLPIHLPRSLPAVGELHPFHWVDRLSRLLRTRAVIGGLEISDTHLRFAFWGGSEWRLTGVRLPPGIMQGNVVLNPEALIQALSVLRKNLHPRHPRELTNVIITLGSVLPYSQVFTLPIIEGESLEKAVDLNIQMITPSDLSQMYVGWQILDPDYRGPSRDILSVFISRKMVDDFNQALVRAGFLAAAVEHKSLAVARLVRAGGAGLAPNQSVLLLILDSSGLDLVILRNGTPYFEYNAAWRDIQGAAQQVTGADLERAVIRNVNQVLNFMSQHWPGEQVSDVLLVTDQLGPKLKEVIERNFPLRARPLQLRTRQAIPPEWFVAVGSGIRGVTSRRKDRDLSLLGIGAREEFGRQQLAAFFEFWRVLIPAALTLALAVFYALNMYLDSTRQNLGAVVAARRDSGSQRQLEALQTEAKEFNTLVTMVRAVEQQGGSQGDLLGAIDQTFQTYAIKPYRVTFQGVDSPIIITGQAPSEDRLREFKQELKKKPWVKDVNLPLPDIRSIPEGVSFYLTIQVDPRVSVKSSKAE